MPHVSHCTATVNNRGKGSKNASTSKSIKFEFAGSPIIRSKNYWVLCYQSIYNVDSYVEKVASLLVMVKMGHMENNLDFGEGLYHIFVTPNPHLCITCMNIIC